MRRQERKTRPPAAPAPGPGDDRFLPSSVPAAQPGYAGCRGSPFPPPGAFPERHSLPDRRPAPKSGLPAWCRARRFHPPQGQPRSRSGRPYSDAASGSSRKRPGSAHRRPFQRQTAAFSRSRASLEARLHPVPASSVRPGLRKARPPSGLWFPAGPGSGGRS